MLVASYHGLGPGLYENEESQLSVSIKQADNMGVSIPRHFCQLRWCLESRPWLPIGNGVQPGIASQRNAFLPKLLSVRMSYRRCRCERRLYSFRRACGLGHAPAKSIRTAHANNSCPSKQGSSHGTLSRRLDIKTERFHDSLYKIRMFPEYFEVETSSFFVVAEDGPRQLPFLYFHHGVP